ncbi:MAG: hypothetical protein HFJ54_07975 [Clostridia bacterium]|nr:hypothetical protein [Clostridia bacterium]
MKRDGLEIIIRIKDNEERYILEGLKLEETVDLIGVISKIIDTYGKIKCKYFKYKK